MVSPRLGVNIDHIATLREVRKTHEPDPVAALPILVSCRVAQVTCHLREDRRHIQDDDLSRILQSKRLPVNLEMAPTEEMVRIACRRKPATATLVPEKRKEITTEGGLDLIRYAQKLSRMTPRLQKGAIRVSFFMDPDPKQIEMAKKLGCDGIELHTGTYAKAHGTRREDKEFERLKKAAQHASSLGLKVFAGHGLNLQNLPPLVAIPEIEEYNIGHSIVARAVYVGLKEAILEIQGILQVRPLVTSHDPDQY